MVDDPASSSRFTRINKYYLQAAKYAARISAGDFSNPGIPKPVFELDAADTTSLLEACKEGWYVKRHCRGSGFQAVQSTAQNDIL